MHVAMDFKMGVAQEMRDYGPREDFTADRYVVLKVRLRYECSSQFPANLCHHPKRFMDGHG